MSEAAPASLASPLRLRPTMLSDLDFVILQGCRSPHRSVEL
jgi:hypothetical protein